ncbi:hypothetical protein [Cribrihabitans neustonicus]|uniref:hypothetical protein n=1 Tax=Cribrihabitans neustonicus TaxID=1429085 RepID=UPI003B59CC67
MNANWIVNMLMRRLIGRGTRMAVDAGLRWLSRRSGPLSGSKHQPGQGGSKPVQTQAQKKADRARIRALRQARRAMRGPKV